VAEVTLVMAVCRAQSSVITDHCLLILEVSVALFTNQECHVAEVTLVIAICHAQSSVITDHKGCKKITVKKSAKSRCN